MVENKEKEEGETKETVQGEFPWTALWIILGSLFLAVGAGWIAYFRPFKSKGDDPTHGQQAPTANPKPEIRISNISDDATYQNPPGGWSGQEVIPIVGTGIDQRAFPRNAQHRLLSPGPTVTPRHY